MKTTNHTETLKRGDTITANVLGSQVTGTITGFGTHKGKPVVDVIDKNKNACFFYVHQIIEKNPPNTISDLLKLGRKGIRHLDQDYLNSAVAVVAFDVGQQMIVLGDEGRMLNYDIIIAIAACFEHKYKGVKWGETENLADWAEALIQYTREIIQLYNLSR